MRKLTLEAEVIMPLSGQVVGETDAVAGGTTPATPQMVRWSQINCVYTPQNLDNLRRRIQNYTVTCPPYQPRPYSQGGNCTRNKLC